MKSSSIIAGLLTAVARLPLGALYLLSDCLYPAVYYFVGYRKKAVRQNLEEAFPEKTEKERKRIEKDFYRYLCDIVVETLKLLHITDREFRKRVTVENAEAVAASVGEGRSAVLLLAHYCNWEWVQEISRCFGDDATKVSIYHPLRNRTWDEVMKRIRSRWGSNIIPMASAVRYLLDKSHIPWICGFIADARPRHCDPGATVEFLHHDMAFIYGPETIGAKVGADFYFLEMQRERRGYYKITFHKLETGTDPRPYPYTRQFWHELERVIRKSPAYWLWSHKRWKYDSRV